MQRRGAGANDFGGVSPVTRDWVNPASRWPHLSALSAASAARGKLLLPRLPLYPEHVQQADKWLDPSPLPHVNPDTQSELATKSTGPTLSVLGRTLACADAAGYARASGWYAGQAPPPDGGVERSSESPHVTELMRRLAEPGSSQPAASAGGLHAPAARWAVRLGTDGALEGCEGPPVTARVQAVLDKLTAANSGAGNGAGYSDGRGHGGAGIGVEDVEVLLKARGASARAVVERADQLRRQACGDGVTYVVNRNINYTNVCTYGCGTVRRFRACICLGGVSQVLAVCGGVCCDVCMAGVQMQVLCVQQREEG